MISFRTATDEELMAMREAIDCVTLARPELIHQDEAWCDIVHELVGEIAARVLVTHPDLDVSDWADYLRHDKRIT